MRCQSAWAPPLAPDRAAAEEDECTGDERTGLQILKRALEAPARQIAGNSARKEFVDLLQAGIVDPAKVVRLALENAASVASVLLLTEATMTEKPGKHEAHAVHEPEVQ